MKDNKELIQKLAACAAACENCMDSCLKAEDVQKMVSCIKLDRDCSKICTTTASFIASHSPHAPHLIKECLEICRQCASECEKHEMDHCQECAKACSECIDACEKYQGVLV